MKKYIIGGVFIVLVIAIIIAVTMNRRALAPGPVVTQESVVGCYAMNSDKDVYTLNITSQEDIQVSGALAFKNYEKDSSRGTFAGTYNQGILLGDYAFQSEGMDSVMQVAFKKSGDDFIRGYGPVTDEGTRFADVNTIMYDELPLSVFKKTVCE